MRDYQCSVADCSGTVWRACERCGRAFCERHARWHLVEYVRGSWSTFTFACYDCVPRNAEEDDEDDEDDEGDEDGSGQDTEASTGTNTGTRTIRRQEPSTRRNHHMPIGKRVAPVSSTRRSTPRRARP